MRNFAKMALMTEQSRNRNNEYNGTYNVDVGTYNGGSEMRRRRDSRGRYMENDNDTEMRYRNEGNEMRRGGYRNEGGMESEMRRGGYRNEGNRMENEMRYRNEDSRMEYDSPESRFRDRRGREHYDNGRFAPMRGMMDGDYAESARNYTPFPPYMPRYERNMIGFGDDTMMMGESRQHAQMQMGRSEGERMDLDQMSAEQWMRNMEKEDGSKGPKWTKEQVKPYMAQVGYHGPEYKFWAVMNALYSDYCKIAKKYGVDRPEYYAELTKAWLEDKDANPEKAGLYYKYIVKH